MRYLKTLVLASAVSALASVGYAADNAAKERQDLMSHVGAATGLGAKIAKGQVEFDANTAQMVMRTLNSAALGFGYMFPEGSETGFKTEASPQIWSDRAGFNAAVQKFAADTAANPADLSAFQDAFAVATANCGACHRAYRVKTN